MALVRITIIFFEKNDVIKPININITANAKSPAIKNNNKSLIEINKIIYNKYLLFSNLKLDFFNPSCAFLIIEPIVDFGII